MRNTVQMTSSGVTTTFASRWSGSVMAKKTARWGKMRETAREQVQNRCTLVCKWIVRSTIEHHLVHRRLPVSILWNVIYLFAFSHGQSSYNLFGWKKSVLVIVARKGIVYESVKDSVLLCVGSLQSAQSCTHDKCKNILLPRLEIVFKRT